MLTGRLWVADLHRLLGGNDRANAIELELLRHDLLPVSRVPGALAAVAGNESQDRADAIAYQVAAYSNHPQVLPQALRHARTQGLKEEYGRLAERLTKVATTFLPQGKKPSLTIPPAPEDWPEEEPSRSLAELANEKFGAISHVEIKGGNPKLIYVPIIHDGPLTHLSSNTMDGVREVMGRCEAISDHLYSQYGVRNIVLEGLGRDFVKRYNSIPEKRRKYTDDGSKQMIVIQTWTKLLAEKGWLLLPASDKTLIGPLTELGYQYDAKIHKAMADAKEKGWFKDRKVLQENKATLEGTLKAIAEEYNGKHETILKNDPGLKNEYAITVTQRNKAFLDKILAADGPGLVFFGAGHWQDLEQQLRERDISYALVVPKGVDWPPAKKDDAAIYADMLELGCQLRQTKLTLGDGTVAEIKVWIK